MTTQKIVIHFGPPKTGTSAIQHWLMNQRDILEQHKVYYPAHKIDGNGVSSGHVWNICDKNDSKVTLNFEKLEALLSDFRTSQCHTLILSSEFFFDLIEDFDDYFESALFIGYVRNPLELFESNYNQSVKRHHNYKLMNLPNKLPLYSLKRVFELSERKNIDIRLRAYLPAAFKCNDIVNDFLEALRIDLAAKPKGYVNRSYSFQAAEFKRWFNGLATEELSPVLDSLLQAYTTEGSRKYTFIPPDKYNAYKMFSVEYIHRLLSLTHVENGQLLIDSLLTSKSGSYKKQELQKPEVDAIATYILKKNTKLYMKMCMVVKSRNIYPYFYYPITEFFLSHESMSMKVKRHLYQTWIRLKALLNVESTAKTKPRKSRLVGLDKLRKDLKVDDSVAQGELLRDMAIMAEQNGQLLWAYELMLEANRLRPNGPLINSKLRIYARQIAKKNL